MSSNYLDLKLLTFRCISGQKPSAMNFLYCRCLVSQTVYNSEGENARKLRLMMLVSLFGHMANLDCKGNLEPGET